VPARARSKSAAARSPSPPPGGDEAAAAPKARSTSPTKRAKKEPGAPKRNLSAYQLFCSDNREAFKARYPGVAFGELTKLLAEAWKGAPGPTKAKYDKLATEDKARYERELKEAESKQA